MERLGEPPDPDAIRDRMTSLFASAKKAAVKSARLEADKSTEKLDDILVEGDFYEALAEFIVDLPLFPFAVFKGPVVRVVPSLTWAQGKASHRRQAEDVLEPGRPASTSGGPPASRTSRTLR